MVVSRNYCSQNGGNLYRAPYYNGNPNLGPRIIGNLDQSPYTSVADTTLGSIEVAKNKHSAVTIPPCFSMIPASPKVMPLYSTKRPKP